MSAKSRRGKHSSQIKKRKLRQQATAQSYRTVSQPDVSAPQTSVPARTAGMSVPSTSVPSRPAGATASAAAPTVVQYPYIITELRRIGILAGVMIVILVVLAFVLP